MIEKLISYCTRQPILVLMVVFLGVVWGVYALKNIPLDAIPDLSDPQVIILTEWKGRAPDLIEDQITYPIVSSMVAAPKVTSARGYSMFGVSFVYLLFEEGTDLYWARSRTLEYLSKIKDQLPAKVNPALGPDASGVGWILSYSIVDESGQNSIEDLRSFQDWKIRYLLEAVPGVAEVASVGGYVVQYQIQVNPNALAQYGITIKEVMQKVRESNRDVGGRILELSEREYFIRGLGYLKSIDDINSITLKTTLNGESVLVKNVATVVKVPDIRRGAVDLNGKGEAASGIVVMRYGKDAVTVINKVKDVLNNIKSSLPKGSHIEITYDRSKVINQSVKTLKIKLLEEMIIVALVILIFLLHFRSALVPVISLPITVIISFIPMYYFGVSLNIMSLAGIAIVIGDIVDAVIILIENAHKSLERWQQNPDGKSRSQVLVDSCIEMGRPIFYSQMIIAISFIPIFALQGQEGRLFKPLAFTKNFSMFFAAIIAVTLGPILIMYLLKLPKKIKLKSKMLSKYINFFWVGKIYNEAQHPVSRFLFKVYHPLLEKVLNHKNKVIVLAISLCVLTIPVYQGIGQEFMPPLNEGDILYMPTTLPGISIGKAKEWLQQQDKLIGTFKEVQSVFGKVGRAETATDPAPLSMVETVIQLKPYKEWPNVYHKRWYSSWSPDWFKKVLGLIWPEQKTRSWDRLIKDLNQTVQLPGTMNAWLFPVKTRIDMLSTGIRTPVGVKVFGDDLAEIEKIAVKVEKLAQTIPQSRSVIADRTLGGYYLDIKILRENLALYGMTIESANKLIEGVIGGMNVTTIIDGRARYSVNVRYQRDFRSDINKLKRSLVTISRDKQIPLSAIADITISHGPALIKDENGLLTSWVFIDLENNTDMLGYVAALDNLLKGSGLFTGGVTYKISGQYEFLLRAKKRLKMIVPLTLFFIIFLLYFDLKSWPQVFIILLSIPFSLIGAFWIIYILGYKLSIAVWVGIIALAGIGVETGIFMLLFLESSYKKRLKENKMSNISELKMSIIEGAVQRVRPKMMAVMTTFVGLLPIMWSSVHETGADVAKRIAAPMVGGIFTSFIMVLLIYPCIYYIWKKRSFIKKN
ncbi:cation transporter [bacterium K02(2017)]|nr:cation transporter [bacterium K02(2017)]